MLNSLLDELHSIENAKAFRAQAAYPFQLSNRPNASQAKPVKSCCLCKTASRPAHCTHNPIKCKHLAEKDRKSCSVVRRVSEEEAEYLCDCMNDLEVSDQNNVVNDMLSVCMIENDATCTSACRALPVHADAF